MSQLPLQVRSVVNDGNNDESVKIEFVTILSPDVSAEIEELSDEDLRKLERIIERRLNEMFKGWLW